MKKFIFAFILISLFLISASACRHQHQWGEWITVQDYTCSTSGVKERVCECGEKESEAIAPSHYYEEGICVFCSTKKASDGLEFTLNSAETEYIVNKGTSSDENIVIPSTYNNLPVTAIGNFSFSTALKSIDIPESIRVIEESAFYGCDNLKSVIIPDSVLEMGENVFGNCSNLEQVNLPQNITKIPARMFISCGSLKEIIIPSSVVTIGEAAFNSCERLRSLVIPDSVESIDMFAFSHCYYLTKVTLGKNLETIGMGAFSACYKLVEVVNLSPIFLEAGSSHLSDVSTYALNLYTSLENNFKQYVDDKGFIFCESKNQLYLIGYLGSDSNVVLPEAQRTYIIQKRAFEENDNLISVTLSESVTDIEAFAFYNCNNLTNVTISRSVKFINVDVLGECDNLESVIFLDKKNWNWKYYSHHTTANPISEEVLMDANEAAILLKITHHQHCFIKN